jgi:chromosome partitioning protein
MKQQVIRTHSIEDLFDTVAGINERGTKILRNMERHIAELGGSLSEEEKAQLGLASRNCARRFSIQEICALFDISRSTFHRFIDDGKIPDRPVVNANGRDYKVGYSLDQVQEMRETLGKVPAYEYPIFLGFLNQKGGVGKSTLTWMFSQYLALRGFRVLIIDTDPQASASFLYGYKSRIDTGYWDTYVPFMLQDDGLSLRQDDSTREYTSELYVDDADANREMIEATGGVDGLNSLHYCIRGTHWKNIDIIPANNELLEIDLRAQELRFAMKKYTAKTGRAVKNSVEVLREGVNTVAGDYDVVLFDGTPSVNMSTMNIFTTCDAMVVPTPCSMLDFASTVEFHSLIQTILEHFTSSEIDAPVPKMHSLLTKFDKNSEPAKFMERLILKTFSSNLLTNYAYHFTEVTKQATNFKTIYEVNSSDTNNSKALKDSRKSFDTLFDEIFDTVLKPLMSGRAI